MKKKMCTLYDWYNCVLLKNWKYYKDSPSFQIEMLKDEFKCKDFIKKMMRVGGKGCKYLNDSLDKLNSGRIKHIVSCFLLGFVFLENISIKNSIDKKLKTLCHDYSTDWEDEFSYIWMLICFFHDLGYAMEEDKNVTTEEDGVFPPQRKSYVFLPSIYTPEAVYAYENYREQKCMVKVDHGIYGGKVCYEKLCKIRKKKEESKDSSHYWGKPLEKVYACISWTIICHNMFFVQEDTEEAKYYKEHDLGKFVYRKRARKIRLKSSPFLFLLCLVDTLEPIKKFGDIRILKTIFLDVDKMKIKIDAEGSLKIDELDKWNNYRESVIGLNDWLCDFQIDDGAGGPEVGAAVSE